MWTENQRSPRYRLKMLPMPPHGCSDRGQYYGARLHASQGTTTHSISRLRVQVPRCRHLSDVRHTRDGESLLLLHCCMAGTLLFAAPSDARYTSEPEVHTRNGISRSGLASGGAAVPTHSHSSSGTQYRGHPREDDLSQGRST